jgi:hypothetical protein
MSPDSRQHRGAHPADRRLFAEDQLPALREATSELSWLLGRDYSIKSALKLVGDRYSLTERQRLAVSRAACSDQQQDLRRAHCLPLESIRGESLMIDGFNLLITLEAALSGGAVFICRDGCLRDLSGVHGSYRAVLETETAIRLAGEVLEQFGCARAKWLLDAPISNSGRLAAKITALARGNGWPWETRTLNNPDVEITASSGIAISSDSVILDRTGRWINLGYHIVSQRLPDSWIVDLRC